MLAVPNRGDASEIEGVRALLKQRPKTTDISQRRKAFDQLGRDLVDGKPAINRHETLGRGRVPCSVFGGEICGNVVLYLHGGAFCIGSEQSYSHMSESISNLTGRTVYFVNYRLAPEHTHPAAASDCFEAYAGLLQAGFAPERIAIVGDSAGAMLAFSVLRECRIKTMPLPGNVVCISPWLDLTLASPSIRERQNRDYFMSPEVLKTCASSYINDTDISCLALNPLSDRFADYPPVLIQVGTDEILFDDSIRLQHALQLAGVENHLEVWEEMCHVWPFFAPILSQGDEALRHIASFLEAS